MITLLIDAASFEAPEVRIEGEPYRHLFRARRVAAGAELRIVDGKGRARWGQVARVERTSAVVALGEAAPHREPAFRLDLLVPTCRPERASWLVEKATEIGVFAIRFLNTVRAPRELGPGTLDRLRRVAAAAVEQCHRSRLPEITGPHSWSEIGRLTGGAAQRWFLDLEVESSLSPVGGSPGRSRGRVRSRGAARTARSRLAPRGSRRTSPSPGDRRRGGSRADPAISFRNLKSKIDPAPRFGLA